MKDYSQYKIDNDIMYSGAEKKYQLTIEGERYIMKFQKNQMLG